MTETKLWTKHIKPLLLKKDFGFFERIDHEMLPDIYTSNQGKVLWIELKCVNKKSSIIKPDWRPGQLAWIREHQNKGGGNTILLCLWYISRYYFLPPRGEYTEKQIKTLHKEI